MKNDDAIEKYVGAISFWIFVFMAAACACVWLSYGARWGMFTIAAFAVVHISLNMFAALHQGRKND